MANSTAASPAAQGKVHEPSSPQVGRVPAAGVVQRRGQFVEGKSPGVAVTLSFFMPGAGQFYNGDAKKGILMLGGYLGSWMLIVAVIGVLPLVGIWIWSMVDGYRVAGKQQPTW